MPSQTQRKRTPFPARVQCEGRHSHLKASFRRLPLRNVCEFGGLNCGAGTVVGMGEGEAETNRAALWNGTQFLGSAFPPLESSQ